MNRYSVGRPRSSGADARDERCRMATLPRLFTAVVSFGLVVAGGWVVPASAAYSSSAAPGWVPNGTVRAIARHGDVVYLGGSFTNLSNPATGAQVPRSRVAAVDADTGAPLPWNPGANGLVRAVAVAPDGRVFLGGDFTAVGGRSSIRLAAVTPGGAPVSGWSASASDSVHDLYADGTSVYVGGRFGTVSRTSRPKLARLQHATGAVVTAFDARVSGGRISTLAPAAGGGSLLLGGSFTAVDGRARGFVASVALGDGSVTDWNPGPECGTCYLWDLAAAGDRVYAAMAGPGGRAVSWHATTGSRGWSRGGDGNAQAIDVHDGVVYVGGHFGPSFGGSTRHQLAALDAGSGSLLSYTVDFTGNDHPGIWAVLADPDGLMIGGGFRLAANPARRYARLPDLG